MKLHLPQSERGKTLLIALLFTAMGLSALHALFVGPSAISSGFFVLSAILFAAMIAFGQFWARSAPASDERFEAVRVRALRWGYLLAVTVAAAGAVVTWYAPDRARPIAALCLYGAVAGPAMLLVALTGQAKGRRP